jgi:hypothetical protein
LGAAVAASPAGRDVTSGDIAIDDKAAVSATLFIAPPHSITASIGELLWCTGDS